MEKKDGGFQVTINVDENGKVDATAVLRTLYVDDDGTVVPKLESVTLERIGDKFPWKLFTDRSIKAALLKAESNDKLRAELAATEELVKQKDAQIEQAKALIADREALVATIHANVAALANATANEIKARQKTDEGARL